VQLNQDIKKGAGVGSGTGVGVGRGQGARPARSQHDHLQCHRRQRRHQHAGFSRDSGGGGLAGRSTTLVAGVAGGGGPVAARAWAAPSRAPAGTARAPATASRRHVEQERQRKASRSIEEVRLVLERKQGCAVRDLQPGAARGRVVARQVRRQVHDRPGRQRHVLRAVSSELKNPELEQKLLTRFRSMTFPAEDVEVLETTVPDRLPAVLILPGPVPDAGSRFAREAGVFSWRRSSETFTGFSGTTPRFKQWSGQAAGSAR